MAKAGGRERRKRNALRKCGGLGKEQNETMAKFKHSLCSTAAGNFKKKLLQMCKVRSTFCGTLIDKVTANQDALTCFYLLHSTPMYKNTDAKTAEFQSRKRKSKRTGEGNKENSEYDGSLDESKSIDELPPPPGAVFEK